MNSIINPATGQESPKWRGIKTTSIPKNEDQAITIVNRLHQKTFSLPRIDDQKRFAGFPGLAGTARKIAKLVPNCKYYVEPFAGTAKVYQELIKRKDFRPKKPFYAILNEKSDFIRDWLQKEMRDATITWQDFSVCMKAWKDYKDAFFLIDPPWFKTFYDQDFSIFDRPTVHAYEEEILNLCSKLKGKFIITTRKESRRMLQSGFRHKLVTSEYVVCGKYPRVLLTHNLDLRRRHEP